MNLACPSCETRFSVGSVTIKPSGQTVKCGRCQHQWRAQAEDLLADEMDEPVTAMADAETPDAETAEPTADIVDNTPVDSVVNTQEDELPNAINPAILDNTPGATTVSAKSSSLVDEIEEKGRGRGWLRWLILLILLALLAAAAMFLRPQIISIWPPATKLYELADFYLIDRYEGLEITASTENGFQQGRPILTIKGEILNTSDRKKELALLRIDLLDKNDNILIDVKRPLAKSHLNPNERLSFSTVMPNPPKDAVRVSVTFIDGG